jgi:hypothetical protein
VVLGDMRWASEQLEGRTVETKSIGRGQRDRHFGRDSETQRTKPRVTKCPDCMHVAPRPITFNFRVLQKFTNQS